MQNLKIKNRGDLMSNSMSKQKKERLAWYMKGVWYEACAAEGHCSFYFGRDRETACKSFQLFQVNEGKIGDVDISGTLAINVIDLYSNKAADLMTKGGEGGLYISDKTTEKQRSYIEPFFVNNVPGMLLLKKVLGTKYVDIRLIQEGNTYHIKMPNGEMNLSLAPGGDGKGVDRHLNYFTPSLKRGFFLPRNPRPTGPFPRSKGIINGRQPHFAMT